MKLQIELHAGDERFHSLVEFLETNKIDWSVQHVLLQTDVSGSLPPTEAEIEAEAEGRYPVKTHSTPDNSPYVGTKLTFIHGVHWGIQKMGGYDC